MCEQLFLIPLNRGNSLLFTRRECGGFSAFRKSKKPAILFQMVEVVQSFGCCNLLGQVGAPYRDGRHDTWLPPMRA